METVPRHAADVDFARKQVDALQLLIESAMEDVVADGDEDALSSVRGSAIMRFQYLTVLDPTAGREETWRAAVFASQVANSVFARTSKRDETVEYQLGEQTVTLPVVGPNWHATPVDWMTAAWLAVITRSEERIQELCSTGKYTLRGSGAKVEDYLHPWIETLQRFLSGEPVSPALLESVIDLSDPENAIYASREYMLLAAYPPVNMLYRILRGTAAQFTEALTQATTAHRDYWSQAELADDPAGFVALPVLAMAIRGRDNGFPIEVESHYLPEDLVNATWSNRWRHSSGCCERHGMCDCPARVAVAR
ncbi:immunity 49 family protein [Lentzea aerocolonigenes]|uniref:immunity 49 family protein n=1 Tax=Lentzea aerocolonigenes TaxID=68170 RepID=UPI000B17A680|nr:immunity 49 family protein [Lentzea aerocolonigenes]MCP2249726.1 Immunity protein 49 [Lentzea aerocolonigenes]